DTTEEVYGYNKASDLTSRTDPNGTTFEHVFDALGRLTQINIDTLGSGVLGATGTAQQFEYDGLGRLTNTTDSTAGPAGSLPTDHHVTDFLHGAEGQGDQVLEERDPLLDDAVLRQYVWGQYIDELVQQREYLS